MKLAITAGSFLVIAVAAGVAAFSSWAHREDLEHDGFEWTYRSKYFPVEGDGCQMLDRTLGANAHSRKRLLEMFGWVYDEDATQNPHGLGHPDFSDVRHQALVRLLALQEDISGSVTSSHGEGGLLVDHTGAELVGVEGGVHVVDGAASVYPDDFGDHPWEGYFRWERFRFDHDGRLVNRRSLNDQMREQVAAGQPAIPPESEIEPR